MTEAHIPPRYPMVRLLCTYGMTLAWLLALIPALCGVALMLHYGAWLWAAGGITAGALLGVLMASYTEVLRIIAGRLIPH